MAALLLKRRHLTPPIELLTLVEQFATIRKDEIPGDCDAVVISRSNSTPLIVLNRDRSQRRQTFTLAHELGHLVIPWHMGTFACCSDFVSEFSDSAYAGVESEANRFASELLLPRRWLAVIVKKSKGLREAISMASKSGVSSQALCLGLIEVLPPGYLFASLDEKDHVLLSGGSPGTMARRPTRGEAISIDQYNSLASNHLFHDGIHWWRFSQAQSVPNIKDARSSGLVLTDICRELKIFGASAEKAMWSINGIIGATNSALRSRDASGLFAALRQRFLDRKELHRIVEHKDFEIFLVHRVRELIAPQQRPRKRRNK